MKVKIDARFVKSFVMKFAGVSDEKTGGMKGADQEALRQRTP